MDTAILFNLFLLASLEKVVEIQETGRLLQTHWVSSADYVDGIDRLNLSLMQKNGVLHFFSSSLKQKYDPARLKFTGNGCDKFTKKNRLTTSPLKKKQTTIINV